MIVTLKPVKQKRQNSETWPEFYIARILEPGLVSYEDVGAGIAMLSKETIVSMLPSFKGKPIIDKRHKDVTPKDYEKYCVGYVTRTFYDDIINWGCVEFMLKDDEAKKSVANGYFVSCGYDNCITGRGGEWHAIPYKEEILGGVGNHVALVESPRYEGGIITPCIEPCMMLVNSKKAIIKEGEGSRNIATLKNATKAPGQKQEEAIVKPLKRICDSCEYLCSNHCDVAGKGGEITLEYAGKRLLGLSQDCSAYEKAEERRKNFVRLKVVKDNKVSKTKKEESK